MARALVLVTLVACGGTSAETWGEDLPNAACRFDERCAQLDFYREYASLDDCIQEQTDYYASISDILSTCSFNADAAEECLGGLKGSCEDWAADEEDLNVACSQVYDCDYGGFSETTQGG